MHNFFAGFIMKSSLTMCSTPKKYKNCSNAIFFERWKKVLFPFQYFFLFILGRILDHIKNIREKKESRTFLDKIKKLLASDEKKMKGHVSNWNLLCKLFRLTGLTRLLWTLLKKVLHSIFYIHKIYYAHYINSFLKFSTSNILQ